MIVLSLVQYDALQSAMQEWQITGGGGRTASMSIAEDIDGTEGHGSADKTAGSNLQRSPGAGFLPMTVTGGPAGHMTVTVTGPAAGGASSAKQGNAGGKPKAMDPAPALPAAAAAAANGKQDAKKGAAGAAADKGDKAGGQKQQPPAPTKAAPKAESAKKGDGDNSIEACMSPPCAVLA